jgi:DNA-binding MarR family transcriptional regulator
MSRGLGVLQRRICEALYAAEGNVIALRELRRTLGEPDRSNLRRAIRGLLEREIVEESRGGGETKIVLSFWGHVYLNPLPDTSPRVSPKAQNRELERGMRAWIEEERRAQEVEAAKWSTWFGHPHRIVRHRDLGETQRRIYQALWKRPGPREEGMLVADLKSMVGGDRSNARRAIRGLLRRGLIEESEDGQRIRLFFPRPWEYPPAG